MDLGIKGRKAIVCASSRGLGKGCAMALAQNGVSLVLNGRDEAALNATAEEISKATGVSATPVIADSRTPAGQAAPMRRGRLSRSPTSGRGRRARSSWCEVPSFRPRGPL